ncbi:MAG: ABC transporter ATP-binding protein [Dermatophilaceae bacterium]
MAVGLQVVAAATTVVPFIAMAELAKAFLTDGQVDEPRVWWAVGIVILALGARLVLGGTALVITHLADLKVQRLTRIRMVERLGRVPLGWFTRHSSGLVRKATQDDIADIHYLIAHGAVETAAAVTVPLAGLAYLTVLDWRLAAVGIVTMPVAVVTFAVMGRDMAAKSSQVNAGVERISRTIVEFVSGIAVVKTFGQAGRAHAAYRKAATEFADAYGSWVRPMLSVEALATIPVSAPVVLLVNLAFGTWFVSAGWVSVVDAVTAAVVAMTIPAAIMKISFSLQSRKTAQAAAARIGTIFDTPVLPEPVSGLVPGSASVEFDAVSFSFDGRHQVLSDVSLMLPEGSVTALVGPSGSGKSTLASLVARFHDPASGRVLIGGVDIRQIATEELYRHVGFVLQDVQLLEATVADNIRLARPGAPLDEVRRVARLAQIDDHIAGLPRGYDSVVGRDALLSGGQAQRVSIARALLADPPILILDEATAFADPESESRIHAALAHLVGGRTLLVIAHRLASITGADQIAVLDRGRIIETGTHARLLTQAGAYARMWHAYQPATIEGGKR